MNLFLAVLPLVAFATVQVKGQSAFQKDTVKSPEGDIEITFIGHGSVMFSFKGTVVYVDPVSQYADFSKMPKAGLILVTHEHGDHLDDTSIGKVRTDKTTILCSAPCAPKIAGAVVMKNGDTKTVDGIKVEAVPAYNLVHMRSPGNPYHPKGSGNGYVITFGSKRIYVAGDTENIPEMSDLGAIDCAFLPMNLPYTMTPEMVAEAAGRIKPKVLYPYHYGNTDPQLLVKLMKDQTGTDVRIRNMR